MPVETAPVNVRVLRIRCAQEIGSDSVRFICYCLRVIRDSVCSFNAEKAPESSQTMLQSSLVEKAK